jgi:hypothetical protein
MRPGDSVRPRRPPSETNAAIAEATSQHARSLPRVRSVIRPLRARVAPPASDERPRPIASASTVRHPPASNGSGAPDERRASTPDRFREYGPSSARFGREWRPPRATSQHARSLPRVRSVIRPLRTSVAPPASDEPTRPIAPATTVRHPPASGGSGAPRERRANTPDRLRESVIRPLRAGVAPPASDEPTRPIAPASTVRPPRAADGGGAPPQRPPPPPAPPPRRRPGW